MDRRKLSLAGGLFLAVGLQVSAHADFLETWESPTVAAGSSSTSLPASWVRFSGGVSDSQVFNPNSTAIFNHVEPLAGPAGGNQLLFLSGVNTGVDRMSGIVIQANTSYELSAAIGNDKLTANTQYWSLQLWADTNHSGGFEGSAGGDTFIGQQFGTNAGAINPTAGDWALNSFTFNSATTPGLVGERLIVFLNNYNNGTSYYDNVSVRAVPEPASIGLLGTGGLGLLYGRIRRRMHAKARA